MAENEFSHALALEPIPTVSSLLRSLWRRRLWLSFCFFRPLDDAMSSPRQDEILRPGKGKWAFVLLVGAVFVATGFWMVTDSPQNRFWAYAGIAFFGLFVLVAFIQFIPGSSFLRLGADGITVRTMWRTTFYRWSDIQRFGVATMSLGARQRFVGLDFSATYPHRDKAQTVKKINRALTGFEGALPDNYGWDYAELAAHLNRLREQYVSSPEPTRAA